MFIPFQVISRVFYRSTRECGGDNIHGTRTPRQWTPVTNAFYVMAKRTRFHQGYPVESKYRSGGYAGPTVVCCG